MEFHVCRNETAVEIEHKTIATPATANMPYRRFRAFGSDSGVARGDAAITSSPATAWLNWLFKDCVCYQSQSAGTTRRDRSSGTTSFVPMRASGRRRGKNAIGGDECSRRKEPLPQRQPCGIGRMRRLV
jgi:hypothetical protein